MGIASLIGKAWTIARLLPQALAESGRRRQWTRALPASAVQLWGGDPASLSFLTVAKHAVYAFRAGDRALIMKIAALSDRTADSILAEIEWVLYLAGVGVPVCRPVPSLRGEYVECIPMRKRKPAVTFVVEKAPGAAVGPADVLDWPAALVEELGEITGQIHAASKNFRLDASSPRREMISKDTLAVARTVIGSARPEIVLQLGAVSEAISRLPRGRDWYGMVHGDLTPVNLFRDEGRLTLFDFESSGYCWFTYDLASPVYSMLVHGHMSRDPDVLERTARFFASFMTGYVRRNVLPIELVECMPAFLAFLSLLNIALFYHQKIARRAKKILAAVEAVAANPELQHRVDFAAIYSEALAASAGRKR
jgi:amicoumacin kinase